MPPSDNYCSTASAHAHDGCAHARSTTTGIDSDQLFNAICHSLSLCRLQCRKGLRKVHRRLSDIAERLNMIADNTHELEHDDWFMAGAVVRVWVAICADAALARGLLQRGILERTLPLVNTDVCSSLWTQLFTLLAHHGDKTVKVEILRTISSMFVRPYQNQTWRSDSHMTSTFIIMALYHCLDAVTFSDTPPAIPNTVFNTALPATVLATHILEHFPKPHVPHASMVHAFPLLISCALSCTTTGLKPVTPVLEFLTMLIKSRNIGLRCVAIWAFGRLCPDVSTEPDSTATQFPLHTIADDRLPPGGEIAESRRCTREMLTLVQDLVAEGDVWQFGVKLADLVMQGRLIYDDIQLEGLAGNEKLAHTDSWDTLLQEAVMVVMKKDCRYRDKGDVLILERGVLSNPSDSDIVAEHAHQILHWEPAHAYAHVVLSENASHLEWALQTVLAGLELQDLTPHLKRRLLLRGLDLSYQKGCAILLGANATELQRLRVGRGWLRVGLDYAHQFIKEAPKDSQDLPHVADLCMCMTLILRGPSLGEDLASIQPILRVLDRSLAALKELGIEVGDNPIRAGNRLFVQHYPRGLEKWGDFLTNFHEQDHMIRASIKYPQKSDRVLENTEGDNPGEGQMEPGNSDSTVWWGNAAATSIHALLHGPLRCCCRASESNGRVQLGPGLVALLQCTWCGDTTALIKRCRGCKQAWYCNSTCQRAHWPEHRKECKVHGGSRR
ncbi:hypothetical protein L226DRAFT_615299 [Lentinus tigrinus ALCF2SS1-7]|uniref:MYND-type domain-containing protein n=1 Tax=Lentinus tigrinus ALCF2SS1-6 TaxID=1328759 RepID=A0A5C2S0S7_9APHY|nr:hypothetical protein L227DRAFT_655824 [Lentinus tigrinus ALCF2SS1-6]RPD71791.1 hypothetical protein L226DRAFT_615299 [Lentinus tigrinus ALCF2SS1-7]